MENDDNVVNLKDFASKNETPQQKADRLLKDIPAFTQREKVLLEIIEILAQHVEELTDALLKEYDNKFSEIKSNIEDLNKDS